MTATAALLEKLSEKQSLTEEESRSCLLSIFEGSWEQSDITKLLSLLSAKGESVDEIVGFAKAMREVSAKVSLSTPSIDLCGTGGTGKTRFNVSTASAFVLASGGVGVAKHGNRGSSSPNGSFDFLEALNIPFEGHLDQLPRL